MSAARNLSPAPNLVPAKHRTQRPSKTSKTSKAIEPSDDHLREADGDLFLARALALSEARHLRHRAVWHTQHPLDEGWRYRETFDVPSYSHPGETHRVVYCAETQGYACTCTANAGFKAPCSHIGATAYLVMTLAKAMAQTEEQARREQLREAMHEEDRIRAGYERDYPGGTAGGWQSDSWK
jgi:hypothetical protein